MSGVLKKRLITFIACGGGGGNCLNGMIGGGATGFTNSKYDSGNFMTPGICIFFGSDEQSVAASKAGQRVQLGDGLGAGAKQDVGKRLAEQNQEKILRTIQRNEAHIFVILYCAGGGTGSGASPVIAKTIKDNYPNSVLLVFTTTPFNHEGTEKRIIAKNSIKEIKEYCDGCMVVNNEDISEVVDMKKISLIDALGVINQKLKGYFMLLAQTIQKHGYMNIDFADMSTVLKDSKSILMYSVMSPVDEILEKMKKMTIEPLHGHWGKKIPSGKNLLISIEDNGASIDIVRQITEYMKNTYHDPTRGGKVIKGYYANGDLVCIESEYALEYQLIEPEEVRGKKHVLIAKKDFAQIELQERFQEQQTAIPNPIPLDNQNNREFPQLQSNYFNYQPKRKSIQKKWVRIFMILAGVEERETQEDDTAGQPIPLNIPQPSPEILVY
jgi:cell division GTPase FtsZ